MSYSFNNWSISADHGFHNEVFQRGIASITKCFSNPQFTTPHELGRLVGLFIAVTDGISSRFKDIKCLTVAMPARSLGRLHTGLNLPYHVTKYGSHHAQSSWPREYVFQRKAKQYALRIHHSAEGQSQTVAPCGSNIRRRIKLKSSKAGQAKYLTSPSFSGISQVKP